MGRWDEDAGGESAGEVTVGEVNGESKDKRLSCILRDAVAWGEGGMDRELSPWSMAGTSLKGDGGGPEGVTEG